MTSLFRSVVNSKTQAQAIKQSIINQLSISIKEIQLKFSEEQTTTLPRDITDDLCTILEAIFIHGMKETFFNKMSFALSSDLDSLPQPNFWPSLLVYSHREVIDQINKLSQIKTDIGRCRAWLRITLNETLASSYLDTMKKDSKNLRHYYKNSAFIRDSECLSIAITMIAGIESCQFDLAFNSSLLNSWTDAPLLLAGLWTQATKVAPVGLATDVAKTIAIEEKYDDSVSSMLSISSFQGSASIITMPVDEDDAIRIILSTPTHNSPFQSTFKSEPEGKTENAILSLSEMNKEYLEFPNSARSAESFSSSSSDKTSGDLVNKEESSSQPLNFVDLSSTDDGNAKESYSSLLESYSKLGTVNKTKNVLDAFKPEDVLPRFSKKKNEVVNYDVINPEVTRSSEEGFEVVELASNNIFDDCSGFIDFLYRIPTDQGLDSQKYRCIGCPQHIGLHFEKAIYCYYFGCYYCPECHKGDVAVIPARVVLNWDFQFYPVSRKAANFLKDIQPLPVFNLKTLNPKLYSIVPDLDQAQLFPNFDSLLYIQKLRLKLYYLAVYLITCRVSDVMDTLQKLIWPREYLYEHINLYTISDLSQIANRTLITLLQHVVSLSSDHVFKCPVCSLKGFICEVCKVPNVIYPFQLEITYQCPRCRGVYHSDCLDASKPCPKCIRKQKYDAEES